MQRERNDVRRVRRVRCVRCVRCVRVSSVVALSGAAVGRSTGVLIILVSLTSNKALIRSSSCFRPTASCCSFLSCSSSEVHAWRSCKFVLTHQPPPLRFNQENHLVLENARLGFPSKSAALKSNPFFPPHKKLYKNTNMTYHDITVYLTQFRSSINACRN